MILTQIRRLERWCRAPASPSADGSRPGPLILITLTQANRLLLLCPPDVPTDFLILFFNAVIFSDFFLMRNGALARDIETKPIQLDNVLGTFRSRLSGNSTSVKWLVLM